LKREFIAGLDPTVLPTYPAAQSVRLRTQLSGQVVSKMLFLLAFLTEKIYSLRTVSLGVETCRLVKGGWKLTKENVDTLIPDLKDVLSSPPPINTSVIFFCLDN
jgi:hypothetical protein